MVIESLTPKNRRNAMNGNPEFMTIKKRIFEDLK